MVGGETDRGLRLDGLGQKYWGFSGNLGAYIEDFEEI